MSLGYGGVCRKALEDEETVIYTYRGGEPQPPEGRGGAGRGHRGDVHDPEVRPRGAGDTREGREGPERPQEARAQEDNALPAHRRAHRGRGAAGKGAILPVALERDRTCALKQCLTDDSLISVKPVPGGAKGLQSGDPPPSRDQQRASQVGPQPHYPASLEAQRRINDLPRERTAYATRGVGRASVPTRHPTQARPRPTAAPTGSGGRSSRPLRS